MLETLATREYWWRINKWPPPSPPPPSWPSFFGLGDTRARACVLASVGVPPDPAPSHGFAGVGNIVGSLLKLRLFIITIRSAGGVAAAPVCARRCLHRLSVCRRLVRAVVENWRRARVEAALHWRLDDLHSPAQLLLLLEGGRVTAARSSRGSRGGGSAVCCCCRLCGGRVVEHPHERRRLNSAVVATVTVVATVSTEAHATAFELLRQEHQPDPACWNLERAQMHISE
jgi:hypothetical protein